MRLSRVRVLVVGLLAVVVALSLPLGAGAEPAKPAAAWSPWMSMRAIAEMPSLFILGTAKEWTSPDIDGNNAVYMQRLIDADGVGPGSAAGDWNIYAVNLSTGNVTTVNSSGGDQVYPRISGNWVVYTDQSGASDEVKAFSLSTGLTRNVTDRANDQNAPDISGVRIVYVDNGNVRLYDLSTGVDSLFASSASGPAISGYRVVYIKNQAIEINDFAAEFVTVLAPDAGVETMPRIDGDYVVFMDSVGFLNYDIVAYTISTASLRVIGSASENDSYPDVCGTIAVWETYGGGAAFLRGYDLVRDKVVTLANLDPTHLTQPMISGNRIACVSAASSNFSALGDIQLGTLKAPTATLSAPSTPGYGATPKLTGRLAENGDSLGGRSLDILKSTNGGFTWMQIGTNVTESDGSYSHTLPATYKRTWFRTRFNGEVAGSFLSTYLSRFSTLSNVKAVTPVAAIGKPAGYPSTGVKNKNYAVHGYLKPRQSASAASEKVVVIKCYRRQNGAWVLRKTVNAQVFDYSTYSRYSAGVKLPYSGRWRMRAYFKGSYTNAAKYSTYWYTEVN